MDVVGVLPGVLGALLTQTPVYLVQIIGIGLAIANHNRYPRAARLTAVALTISIIVSIVVSAFSLLLPLMAARSGTPFEQIAVTSTAVSLIFAAIQAVVWGLILAAIFGRRE